MTPLTPADLLPLQDFLAQRKTIQRDALAARQVRRLGLGENMTLLFENRTTARWQILEMCRVELILKPEAVQHELDTYNALIPKGEELSATLLVEYPDADERDRMLPRLVGLQDSVTLVLEGAGVAQGAFDPDQFEEGRISAVQFVRFPLDPDQVAALCDLRRAATLVVDHPAYQAETAVSGAVRGALVADLLAD